MADIYNLDVATFTKQLTPTRWRLPRFTAFFNACTYALQWSSSSWNAYRYGFNATAYSSVTAYVVGNRVKYGDAVYQCYVDCTGIAPTDSNYWNLYSINWIGTNDRQHFNPSRNIFEWMLNKQFGTTFRQPNLPIRTNHSDIYIGFLDRGQGFNIGVTESASSVIGLTIGDGIAETEIYGTANFAVYVPSATYSASLTQIKAFIDKYKPLHQTYTVISY